MIEDLRDKELRERIAEVVQGTTDCFSCDNYDSILARIKETLPELAKEAGYKSPEEHSRLVEVARGAGKVDGYKEALDSGYVKLADILDSAKLIYIFINQEKGKDDFALVITVRDMIHDWMVSLKQAGGK